LRKPAVLECGDDFGSIGRGVFGDSKTVVYPTDTVYGLGANPLSNVAVEKCFEIKGREKGKPFPILFSSISRVRDYAVLSELAFRLAKEFWPGKLTIISEANPATSLPRDLLFNSTVAVRIPRHECALRLIEACGGALIGTSANLSGRPPVIDADDQVLIDLTSKTDYFVRGHCGETAEPSTIVDATSGQVRVIRQGAVPSVSIEKLIAERK
jgi:L-threonylcarbamoyladenylate synthase